MYRKLYSIPLMGLSCILLACDPEDSSTSTATSPSAEIVVAQVGEELIYQTDVERLISTLGPGLRSKEIGDAARRDYLQSLIDQQLLVLAAKAHSLDTVLTYRSQLSWKFREKVVNTYQAANINARIAVDEEELRQLFGEGNYQQEKLLSHLVVKSLEEAQDLQQQTEQGADFAALAAAHSVAKNADRGGRLGYANRVTATRFAIPAQVFANLAPGSVSEPLPMGSNFQLVYCLAEQEGNFADYRSQLYKDVWREKFVTAHRALIEELAVGFELRPFLPGLAILMGKDPNEQTYPNLSPEEAITPLYVYDGGRITVEHYVESFRRARQIPALGDSLQIIHSAWQLPIPKTMVWEAAVQMEYNQTTEMVRWKKRLEAKLLILALRKAEVNEKVTVSPEAVSQYYQDNLDKFRTHVEIWIEEILVDDLDQANELRRRLDGGETIADLSHLTQRHAGAENRGSLHVHSYQKAIYGNLVDHAMQAELGQLVGPVQVKDGYSVFRAKERSGGQMQSFETVSKRIEAILRVVEQEKRFNELVDELREQYADQVRIVEEALPQIRLPAQQPST